MKKIASFEVDHTTLQPGMYLSRTDGGVVTYDLRFIRPNTPPFLPPAVLHTVEHTLPPTPATAASGRISSTSGRWAAAPAFIC